MSLVVVCLKCSKAVPERVRFVSFFVQLQKRVMQQPSEQTHVSGYARSAVLPSLLLRRQPSLLFPQPTSCSAGSCGGVYGEAIPRAGCSASVSTNQRPKADGVIAYVTFYALDALTRSFANGQLRQTHAAGIVYIPNCPL